MKYDLQELCHPKYNAKRTHQDKHTVTPQKNQAYEDALTSQMNLELRDRVEDNNTIPKSGITMTFYADKTTQEKVIEILTTAYEPMIDQWLKECKTQPYNPNKPQRLTINTKDSYGLNKTSKTIASLWQPLDQKTLNTIPKTSIEIGIEPGKNNKNNQTRPKRAYLARQKHQELTLQYNPKSPNGFNIVTVYPKSQGYRTFSKLKRDHDEITNPNLCQTITNAYLNTNFAKYPSLSRKCDNVTITTSLNPNMYIWYPDNSNETKIVADNKYSYFLKPEGIYYRKYGQQQAITINQNGMIEDQHLRPLQYVLDQLYETSTTSTKQSYPKPNDTQPSPTRQFVNQLYQDLQKNPKQIGNLEPVSIGDTTILKRIDKPNSNKEYAITIQNNQAFISKSINDNIKTPLTISMLNQNHPKTALGKTIHKYAKQLRKFVKTNNFTTFDQEYTSADEIDQQWQAKDKARQQEIIDELAKHATKYGNKHQQSTEKDNEISL